MKISVITISFNQSKYIRKCIDSVLSQNYQNFEYIIVDPGSTDGSREIIKSYGDSIVKVFEIDNGPADGLNKGFSHANGDIYCFLNSDDEFLPEALSKIAEAFLFFSKAAVISGCGYFVDSMSIRLKAIVPTKLTPMRYALGAVTIFQQGTFFRREWFDRVGGFNTNNRTCWDGELFLDMALAGARFETIGADLAYFRLHDDSITGSGRLNAPYMLDSERSFSKVFNRRRTSADRLLILLARIDKWLLNPRWFIRRLVRLW